eukprot:s2186_g7.t1
MIHDIHVPSSVDDGRCGARQLQQLPPGGDDPMGDGASRSAGWQVMVAMVGQKNSRSCWRTRWHEAHQPWSCTAQGMSQQGMGAADKVSGSTAHFRRPTALAATGDIGLAMVLAELEKSSAAGELRQSMQRRLWRLGIARAHEELCKTELKNNPDAVEKLKHARAAEPRFLDADITADGDLGAGDGDGTTVGPIEAIGLSSNLKTRDRVLALATSLAILLRLEPGTANMICNNFGVGCSKRDGFQMEACHRAQGQGSHHCRGAGAMHLLRPSNWVFLRSQKSSVHSDRALGCVECCRNMRCTEAHGSIQPSERAPRE